MISPSQLKTAKGCLRKWGFDKLARLPRSTSPAMQFGLDGHSEIEKWLTEAKVPDQSTKVGRLASEGIPHLPKPGTCHVEIGLDGRHRIEGQPPSTVEVDGVPFCGYIDVVGLAGDTPTVFDHKFTGRPDLALTVDTLRADEQGIIYPYFVSLLWPGHQYYGAVWIYYPKTNRKVFTVPVLWESSELRYVMHSAIVPRARLLHKLKNEVPKSGASIAWVNGILPCQPQSCDWVGLFCDFQNHCTMRNNDYT